MVLPTTALHTVAFAPCMHTRTRLGPSLAVLACHFVDFAFTSPPTHATAPVRFAPGCTVLPGFPVGCGVVAFLPTAISLLHAHFARAVPHRTLRFGYTDVRGTCSPYALPVWTLVPTPDALSPTTTTHARQRRRYHTPARAATWFSTRYTAPHRCVRYPPLPPRLPRSVYRYTRYIGSCGRSVY